MQIYIHRNNQQLGPFTEAEIKAQLAAGTASPEDHVWWQGQANWVPMSQSPLMAVISEATPDTLPLPSAPLPGTPIAAAGSTSQMAIWSLVLGCLGFFFSIFTSVPAVILGHMSLSQIKKNPGLKGHGMALAGTILGYIFTALLPVVSIIAISVLIALGNQVQGTFKTINAQLNEAQATHSDEQPSTNADSTTNAPDQSTPAPASTTTTPDQSTNSAPTNTPDESTNAPAQTNSSDSSTNTSTPNTNAAPMSQ
jgi:hypothetical protein